MVTIRITAEDRKFDPTGIEQEITLFPQVTRIEIEQTIMLLRQYREMELAVRDYELQPDDFIAPAVEGEAARRISSQDVHADKTPNAVIVAENQRFICQEYKTILEAMNRAQRLILDEDAANTIRYRFFEGHDYANATSFFTFSNKTFDRKLKIGIKSMANTLMLWGVLEQEWLKR